MKNLSESELQAFFEENSFNVHLFENDENGKCAEIEAHTEGGVNMIIMLAPFLPESFIQYVKDFDVDAEIEASRHDDLYCKHFTIRQSLADFEKFKRFLKKAEFGLLKLINQKPKYPNQYEAEATLALSEALNSVYIGGTSKTKTLIEKLQNIKQKHFNEVFGGKSPWTVSRGAKGKNVVIWDSGKAKKLGIE